MDTSFEMSARANAFTIANLMSDPSSAMEGSFLPGFGGYNPAVPPQHSTDCYFDWGQPNSYMPGLKGMEGKHEYKVSPLVNTVQQHFIIANQLWCNDVRKAFCNMCFRM